MEFVNVQYVKNIIIQDLKDIFVKDYVYPMIRGHAVYEGVYLLGTSIARPLIAKDQMSAKNLSTLFKEHKIVKTYLAIVSPCPILESGIIDKPLYKFGSNFKVIS